MNAFFRWDETHRHDLVFARHSQHFELDAFDKANQKIHLLFMMSAFDPAV